MCFTAIRAANLCEFRHFVFSLITDHRQGSHDLGEGGAVRGKLADTSIFDSRFFHISCSSNAIYAIDCFHTTTYFLRFPFVLSEAGQQKCQNLSCRQNSLDKRLAVCTLDEEVNEDGLEEKDPKRVKPLLIRGILVKEESHESPGQQGQGPGYRCQDQESVLPLSPGILVNGFPL